MSNETSEQAFLRELKTLLKKWDAEIWVDNDDALHPCLYWACNLMEVEFVQGSFGQFVNGDD